MTAPLPGSTLAHLFLDRIRQSNDQVAIQFYDGTELKSRTWNEMADDVFRLVAGLRGLGLQPGDRVAQLAENRYEWIVTDLGLQLSQTIHVPIHAPLAAEQVSFQVNHSGAKAIVVSGCDQWDKLRSVQYELPAGLHVIAFEEKVIEKSQAQAQSALSQSVHCLAPWLLQQDADAGRQLADEATQALSPNSLGSIIYTSGTTGQPKGVMLSQDNLVTNATSTVSAFGMTGDDVRLNFLPLSHIFARTCDLYTWIANGSQLCLATSRDSVLADCQWSKPTLISGVPYFFDRIRRYLIEQGLDQQVGSLRALLGGEMNVCCSGGAALPDHVFDFYEMQGVPILQGYGLTETSPVISLSSPTEFRRSASGKAIKDVEVAIADDGEIITRGPHVMQGYWQDEAATAEVMKDGWFHTGDYGAIDEDGYVSITGRKKELIVTAAGKNVAPVLLESLLTEDPLMEQVLVVGDNRNFLTALIVPNWEAVQRELPQMQSHAITDPAARTAPEVQQLFDQRIEACLACVSYHEQVRKHTLLARPFSIELGEMTPKLSLRRTIIHEHFADEIEAMYRK